MDARRQERTRLIYSLRLFLAETRVLLGYLVDITPEGIMVIGDQPQEAGARLALEMDLPKNVMNGGQLSFQGEIKWCREDNDDGLFTLGIRLLKMAAESQALIQELTDRFHQESLADEEAAKRDPYLQHEDPSNLI